MPPRCSWRTVSSSPIPSTPAMSCCSGCKLGADSAAFDRDLAVVSALEVKRNVDQANHRWNLDQRADHRGKRLTRIDPDHPNRYGDGKFKIVAGRGEGERCRLGVVGL